MGRIGTGCSTVLSVTSFTTVVMGADVSFWAKTDTGKKRKANNRPGSERDDEVCDTRDDDSSAAAGLIISKQIYVYRLFSVSNNKIQ